MKAPISISYTSDKTKIKAIEFATANGYHCLVENDITTKLKLNFTDELVELCDREKSFCIHIDFISGNLAHRQQYGGGKGQSIAKAIGLKQGKPAPSVLDATAGLAKDAFVLACLGCRLTLLERSEIIVALIEDAISRAKENELFQPILNTGFEVICKSSIDYLTELHNKSDQQDIYPDVIYLDPMYPDRKKSASVKKNMQILQSLLGKDEDSEELLTIALKVARQRVVVKRPKGAATLSQLEPTYQVNSKKTRYDVYITKTNIA